MKKSRGRKKSPEGRKTSQTSHVWNHFEKLSKDENETPKCECIYCGNEFSCPTSNDTTQLNNYYRKSCRRSSCRNNENKQNVLSFETLKEGEKSLVAVAYNKEACRIIVVRYIAVDELPFRHVEGVGFKEFVRTLQPRFEIPSRITIARDVLKNFCEEKEKLKNILKHQSVSITTDTWTSIQNLNYMVITAYWVDDNFNYQKRIITFCIVEDHKGDTIAKHIHESLDEWGITKLFAITIDNVSSTDVVIRSLRQKYSEMANGLILNGKFLHMRCCAHIINLIVVESLKENSHSILAIRNAVRYVRSSPVKLKMFKEQVEKANIECKGLLKLDVPTRWNSTFLMLKTALKFKDAFKSLLKDLNYMAYFDEVDEDGNKKDGPPIELDWENAKVFVQFLRAFHEVIVKFSDSTYVTSNKYFITINGIQQHLYKLSLAENEDLLVSMAKSMKEKYDKYWENIDKCNEVFLIALVLDPRYKLNYFNYYFRNLHGPIKSKLMVNKIETTLRTLFEVYGGGNEQSQLQLSVPLSQGKDTSTTTTSASDFFSFLWDDIQDEFLQERIKQNGEVTKNELDKYFSDDTEPFKMGQLDHFDILKWWCVNSSKYPTLSKIARDVLAVPASTVASEAAFSIGGRILNPFKSSLNPTYVEALICLKNWWSQSHQPIIVREYEDEEEGLPTTEDLTIDVTPTTTATATPTTSGDSSSSIQSTSVRRS